jgi:hypothetical protein
MAQVDRLIDPLRDGVLRVPQRVFVDGKQKRDDLARKYRKRQV